MIEGCVGGSYDPAIVSEQDSGWNSSEILDAVCGGLTPREAIRPRVDSGLFKGTEGDESDAWG